MNTQLNWFQRLLVKFFTWLLRQVNVMDLIESAKANTGAMMEDIITKSPVLRVAAQNIAALEEQLADTRSQLAELERTNGASISHMKTSLRDEFCQQLRDAVLKITENMQAALLTLKADITAEAAADILNTRLIHYFDNVRNNARKRLVEMVRTHAPEFKFKPEPGHLPEAVKRQIFLNPLVLQHYMEMISAEFFYRSVSPFSKELSVEGSAINDVLEIFGITPQ